MPRLIAPLPPSLWASLWASLLALVLLAACQPSLPGRDGTGPAAANPVTGGTITTTTLDAPAPSATATPAPDPTPDPRPQARPTPEAPPEAPPETPQPGAGATAAPEIPAALKSPGQIACEKDRGRWARAGKGGGMSCIYQTRDGGKRCDSKDDCQGECLARSRTCSPIRPLFGCNAVLIDTGAEMTLCLD